MGQQFNVKYNDFEIFEEKYRIGDHLGSGQYGNVNELNYKNLNPNNEELAVKQIKCENRDVKKLENEIESFKKIQLLPEQYRKGILEVKEVYWDPLKTMINLVLPKALYSLQQEINAKILYKTNYTQQELCYKISCAFQGLLTLETLGMVHRDIKTENLLVMKDGSLKIADLGTVKKLQYQIQTLSIKDGVGTMLFWSPEQMEMFLQLKENDYYEYISSPQAQKDFKTSDLYAMGLCFVLAATLSQLPAFETSQSLIQERQVFLDESFVKLREEKKYSPDLISLLENLVNQKPSKRYSLLQAAQKLSEIQNW